MSTSAQPTKSPRVSRARWARFLAEVAADVACVAVALALALVLAYDGAVPAASWAAYPHRATILSLLAVAVFSVRGLYFVAPRYMSLHDFLNAALGGALLGAGLFALRRIEPISQGRLDLTVPILFAFLATSLTTGYRVLWRIALWRRERLRKRRETGRKRARRTLVVGAGDAGETIVREIQRLHDPVHALVGLADDSAEKRSIRIHGVPVLGQVEDVPGLVERYDVEEILIAIPSAEGDRMRRIVDLCSKTGARVRTLPALSPVLTGEKSLFRHLREVEIEDLLRREPVRTDLSKAAGYVAGEHVLVTGGGGSIGGELARQIARLNPASLILVGKGENSIYEIEQELVQVQGFQPASVIADVRDARSMDAVYREQRPNVVFHAAAHKHVPLMQSNPIEAIRNNVFGTLVASETAVRYGVKRFIYVSTDKAVNPTSIMGASKRVGEMIVSAFGRRSDTHFSIVRFGNVLGSRGSLIPMLKAQIKRGGPVRITHPEMTRYFMTIPEAVQLIVQAGSMGRSGEIFILDMGEPVKILDLANELIRLHGLIPGEDVPIQFIGVRPGEKLYEELVHDPSELEPTEHPKIRMTKNLGMEWDWLKTELEVLRRYCDEGKQDEARKFLMELAWGNSVPPISGVPIRNRDGSLLDRPNP